MKAKIVENLLDSIVEFFSEQEGHKQDEKFLSLCSIE